MKKTRVKKLYRTLLIACAVCFMVMLSLSGIRYISNENAFFGVITAGLLIPLVIWLCSVMLLLAVLLIFTGKNRTRSD